MFNTFNAVYSKKVDSFLKRVHTDVISGMRLLMYNSSTLHVERSPEYRLPPDIIQLLAFNCVVKLYAHPIIFGLNIDTPWHGIHINVVNKIPTTSHYFEWLRCDACGNNLTNSVTGRWSIRSVDYDLCEFCYSDGLFGGHSKDSFIHHVVPTINFMDWVVFGKCKDMILYTNCNPNSDKYGHIAAVTLGSITVQGVDYECCSFDILYKNAQDFILDITEWMLLTSVPPEIDILEYLSRPVGMVTYRDILEKKVITITDEIRSKTRDELKKRYPDLDDALLSNISADDMDSIWGQSPQFNMVIEENFLEMQKYDDNICKLFSSMICDKYNLVEKTE